jgi:hypothetical protein
MNGTCIELPDKNWICYDNSPNKKGYQESGAIFDQKFSENPRYRYSLFRVWNQKLPKLVFIMLNCSKGNHLELANSSMFCEKVARNGIKIKENYIMFGSFEIVNLFAFISPDKTELKKAMVNIIGPDNNKYIENTLDISNEIIVAWGDYKNNVRPEHLSRDIDVLNLIKDRGRKPYCLKHTKNKFPLHPNYCVNEQKRKKMSDNEILQWVRESFSEYTERPDHHR